MTSSIARKIALAGAALALAAGTFGCAAGAVGIVSTVAPMAAMGSAQVISATGASRDTDHTDPKDSADSEACDQLVRVPVGVEEVRITKEGTIESREFKVISNGWIVVAPEGAPDHGWAPKPGIANLMFDPPLYQMLKPKEPQYLAYAPAGVQNVQDSEQFDTMVSAFGAGIGTFKWRGRTYSYVLVKELPCFKPPKDK